MGEIDRKRPYATIMPGGAILVQDGKNYRASDGVEVDENFQPIIEEAVEMMEQIEKAEETAPEPDYLAHIDNMESPQLREALDILEVAYHPRLGTTKLRKLLKDELAKRNKGR
jgi:hypothetical protein